MLTRKVQRNLDSMLQDPNFRLVAKGDSFFATAEGHRPRRVMFQGDLTPAGQYLSDNSEHGWNLQLPADRVDPNSTEFRGNSEWAVTQSGKRVKLRTPQGLTKRGEQVYERPELTVEVPALSLIHI